MFLKAIQGCSLASRRFLSSTLTEGEQRITGLLKQRYPDASLIETKDISGNLMF